MPSGKNSNSIRLFLKTTYLFLINFGFNPLKIIEGFKGLRYYIKDYRAFNKKMSHNGLFGTMHMHPIFGNRFQKGGILSGHYFHQDLYMARKIYQARPKYHLDIGSRTDGFVAHLAVFMEVEVMDIRPLSDLVLNIKYLQADLSDKSFPIRDYTSSVSCLHALEHFGLGRYGDPIDPEGYLTGWNNIYACLKPQGIFYFSTPIGPQRIEFNAHRVFSLRYLLDLMEGKYEIISFSYVDDVGNLHENVPLSTEAILNNLGCQYGCGLFELRKI
ncbi:MAG: DUF268 domain-containing protein [Saprospiraceae bacterium]|nr:DUF268 domain-containing protein [Saprospiraceae bacterium]